MNERGWSRVRCLIAEMRFKKRLYLVKFVRARLKEAAAAQLPSALGETQKSGQCGAYIKQTVRKLGLSGFLRGVGDVRIAHDPHRRIRTGPASVVAGGG